MSEILTPYKGKYKVTQPFKMGVHNGIDLVGVSDKTLYAICDGYIGTSTIITDRHNRTWEWGNYVKLVADNDDEVDDGLLIYYCHLSKRLVEKGQRVKKGDPIGIEGNTGYSFGSHCHFEIRDRDNKVKAVINTPAVTNIPNKRGTYESEDEELMSKEYDELKAICDKQSKQIAQQQKEISAMKAADPIYKTVADLPEWGKPSIEKAIAKGIVEGTGKNKKGDIIINMLESLVRAYVSMDRAGLY